jgi:hypothetical protein
LSNLSSKSETCVGSRVHLVGATISFDKNFYWLPFTSHLSGSLYRSFKWYQRRLQVSIDSNQSKIQGWCTRNGVRVLHTSLAKTTRCGVSGWRCSSAERVRSFGMSWWTRGYVQPMNFLAPGSRDMFDANNKAVDYLFRALCQHEFDRVHTESLA